MYRRECWFASRCTENRVRAPVHLFQKQLLDPWLGVATAAAERHRHESVKLVGGELGGEGIVALELVDAINVHGSTVLRGRRGTEGRRRVRPAPPATRSAPSSAPPP